MTKITWTMWLVGLQLLASQGWAAPRPLELVVMGELPFSRQELVELVRLRLPVASRGDQDRTRAVVRSLGADTVEIRVADRARVVKIAPEAGRDGARLVSLLLLDLVTDVEGQGPSAPVVVSRPGPAPRPTGEPRLVLGFSTATTFLARDDEVGVEPVIDLQLHLARSCWAWFEAGYSWTPAWHGPYPSYLATEMHQVVARAGLAYRWAWFGVYGGLVARPYWLAGGSEYASVLAGGTLAVRASWRVGQRLVMYGILGVDLLVNRDTHEAVVDGFGMETVELMHTNWVVPWVGLGVAYRGWRG